MPLELRRNSNWWYGRYAVDGRRFCVNLRVKVPKNRPERADDPETDRAFIASRAAADVKLKGIIEEAQSRRGAARLIEKVYEMKTGIAIETVATIGVRSLHLTITLQSFDLFLKCKIDASAPR